MQFYDKIYTMSDLLNAGVHYGHKKQFWNPRLAEHIYSVKNGIHIVDLRHTVVALEKSLEAVKKVSSQNGRILFVCTRQHSRDVVAEHARKCGQYYINVRWLGGMLTNWPTVFSSLNKLKKYRKILADKDNPLLSTKKERLSLQLKCDRMESIFGGVLNMGGLPDLVFVIGIRNTAIAVKESNKMGIKVCGIVDTNCSEEGVDYPVYGNDDSFKSIDLFCRLVSEAALMGIQESVEKSEALAK